MKKVKKKTSRNAPPYRDVRSVLNANAFPYTVDAAGKVTIQTKGK
jgi:hypothetical protein